MVATSDSVFNRGMNRLATRATSSTPLTRVIRYAFSNRNISAHVRAHNRAKGKPCEMCLYVSDEPLVPAETWSEYPAYTPEFRNVILPTSMPIFSRTTSLKIFRSTWKGIAPWSAASALASHFRSACSTSQSHSNNLTR